MKSEKDKRIIKFEDLKNKIVEELNKRLIKVDLGENITLIDGFLNEPFSKELSNSIVISGPTVPMIMLVGNDTGRVYFFALKAILKELEI